MKKTKLTVRVPRDLLENIKRYAAQNNTTLTNLIEAYLRRTSYPKGIPSQQRLENAPIVRRLSSTLSPDVTVQDYRQHLDEKYG
jgi:antitoxin component of RelBE/YafQ-DinJ toxin-antitoxin module